MGFIKYSPLGPVSDITTSGGVEQQVWQELTMLRFIKGPSAIYGKLATAPLIDQAKVYYLDAMQANWKSAGLLYYYGFLNLAKSFLLSRRVLTANVLASKNIYHGLSAQPQNPKEIGDFAVEIHLPRGAQRNVFASLYEVLVGQKWPFNSTVSIKAKEFLSYCFEISHELDNFYGTPQRILHVQSLVREQGPNVWAETIVQDKFLPELCTYLQPGTYSILSHANMSTHDFQDWLLAHNRVANSMSGSSLIRSLPLNSVANRAQTIQNTRDLLSQMWRDYACARPVTCDEGNFDIVLKCSIQGVDLRWHPVLSDYLFAFVLSTILRYYPHLVENGRDAFLSEAWCNQSAKSTLRYFLMMFTNPSVRFG